MIVTDQKISETTPKMLSCDTLTGCGSPGLKTVCTVYNGLVPMSPKTTPSAPTASAPCAVARRLTLKVFAFRALQLVRATLTNEPAKDTVQRAGMSQEGFLVSWRSLEAEKAFEGGEAAGAVDPDGLARGFGHDDQGAGAEDVGRVAAGVPDQGAGQALAAGFGVGLDVLVTGVPVTDVEQPELREQATAGEGAEPGAPACLGQLPADRGPALEVHGGLGAVEAADSQVDGLPPVVVGGQR